MRKVYNYGYRKEEPEKYAKGLQEIQLLCKCGHSIMIPVQDEDKICSYCGNKVKNGTWARFKYLYFKTRREKDKCN